jgi:hypothetical protein
MELLLWQEQVDSNRHLVLAARTMIEEGDYEGTGEEDLSAVQWQSPSDFEGVMDEIEQFNRAMADRHIAVGEEEEGAWV